MRKQVQKNNDMPKWLKIVNLIVFVAIVFVAISIISSDVGNYSDKLGGAGDIWWADVPAVEESYQHITGKNK